MEQSKPARNYNVFTQGIWASKYGENFASHACAATAIVNACSADYTQKTGQLMDYDLAANIMAAAVEAGEVRSTDANVEDWEKAAAYMRSVLYSDEDESDKPWSYSESDTADIKILAVDNDADPEADHFVNGEKDNTYIDTYDGSRGNVNDLSLQENRPTRGYVEAQ